MALILVDKDGNEVTRYGGVTTPEGISSQDVTFASPGSFNVRVEDKGHERNGAIRPDCGARVPNRHRLYSDYTCNSCNYNSCQEDVVPSDGEDVLDTSSHLFYVR
ncbi:MAG TPA: hypothetical protein VE521_07465 [Nitrososphaera sp.]|nr:hypothetical protein [Nitrososphaera sp.]